MKKNLHTIGEAISKNWFKALLIVSLIIVSFGCSTLKTKTNKTTDTNTLRDIKEIETVKSTRKGDTISYTIRSISENENKKEELRSKVKESFFKPIYFLYLFLGLAFLMLFNKITNKLIN